MQTYTVQVMSEVSGATFPASVTIEAENSAAAERAASRLPQVVSVNSSRALSATEVAALSQQ